MSTTSTVNVATPFNPDLSSPMHLLSSDVPGISLIPVLFSGTRFGAWRRNMVVSLSARNKIAFIDGSCPKPSAESPQLRQWNKYNHLVLSWITSSLSPDIAESVQYSETAESMWNKLNKRYGIVNGTRVFELKKEIASSSQGCLDIASYFNKLKRLWDELGFMRRSNASKCTCEARVALLEEEEENKLYQFLMGLNKTYVSVRGNILMMDPLSSLDSTYSILLQDERQRQVNAGSQFSVDSASFNVNANRKAPTLSDTQFIPKVNFRTNNQFPSKPTLICKYCKKTGHLIDKCHKLHGYPPHFKFTKGTKTAAHVEVHTGESSGSSEYLGIAENSYDSGSIIPGLSKEQYTKLMIMLQQNQISDSQPCLMASTNFAGPFTEEATGSW